MFYYFYKITNLINNKYYYGVHSTNNLNDGYLGSGVAIKRACKKYGKKNFSKEILYYFNNKEEMYSFEKEFVNEKLIQDPMCYNMTIGGNDSEVYQYRNKLINREGLRQKIINYWNTGDIESKRKKQSEMIKNFLKNCPAEKIKQIRENISKGLTKYWNDENSDIKRKKHSELIKQQYIDHPERRKKIGQSLKNSKKYKQWVEKMKQSEKNKGYNNSDFIKRWKPIYDNNALSLCNWLLYTNLPDDFIIKTIFKKNVKSNKLIKYYQHIDFLPKKCYFKTKEHRFLRFDNKDNKGHKDGGSVKTKFGEEKYHCVFVFNDFFEQFEKIKEINKNMEISDSAVEQGKYHDLIPNFKQVLEYFQEIGIVKNIRKIKIKVPKIVQDKNFYLTTTKTVFDLGKIEDNIVLIDKELNHYGIDDNGKPFFKGRFEL